MTTESDHGIHVANAPVSYGAFELTVGIDPHTPDGEHVLDEVAGAGYAGIEVLGELQDMARYACRYYQSIEPTDMRWVLVEASNRIMPEVSPGLGR